jgi:hypothetical protein
LPPFLKVSSVLIFPLTYMCTQCLHHIPLVYLLPTSSPLSLVSIPPR